MKKQILLSCFTLCLIACTSSRRTTVVTTKKEAQIRNIYTPGPKNSTSKTTESAPVASETVTPKDISSKAQSIINTALSYDGTPYKYTGTTRSGMDCSGLVYTSFTKNNVTLERSSYLMATQGKRIKLSDVRPGDLVFFVTGKDKRRINHVGLVVEANANDIKFIHATTSRGVLISSMREPYWDSTFVEARNIL